LIFLPDDDTLSTFSCLLSLSLNDCCLLLVPDFAGGLLLFLYSQDCLEAAATSGGSSTPGSKYGSASDSLSEAGFVFLLFFLFLVLLLCSFLLLVCFDLSCFFLRFFLLHLTSTPEELLDAGLESDSVSDSDSDSDSDSTIFFLAFFIGINSPQLEIVMSA
jgi:hypothetical protein